MITESSNKMPFKRCRRFRLKPITPLNRNGLLTKAGVKQYQERFMQENHNRLYGTAYGMEVGMSDRVHIGNRMKNVFVVGASGTGKSYNYVLPNLLTESHSAVVLDSSDMLYKECGDYLRSRGHKVWYFSIINHAFNEEFCCHFDPFKHIENKKTLVNIICGFLLDDKSKSEGGDPFYTKLENDTFRHIVEYVVYSDKLKDEERNLVTVMNIVNELASALPSSDYQNEKSLLSKYKIMYTNKGLKCYHNAMCGLKIRLAPFMYKSVLKSFIETPDTDNINIEALGSKQSYLFIGGIADTIFEDAELSALERLLGLLTYSIGVAVQAYAKHCLKDNTMLHCSHFLPHPLHYYLDDFKFYHFPILSLAFTDRRYGVSCSYITDDIDSLEKLYGEDWLTFYHACDTLICTGTMLHKDAEFVSNSCGRLYSSANSRDLYIPQVQCDTEEYQNSKPIVTPDDVLRLSEEGKWLVSVRDVYPVICDKLDPKIYRKK